MNDIWGRFGMQHAPCRAVLRVVAGTATTLHQIALAAGSESDEVRTVVEP